MCKKNGVTNPRKRTKKSLWLLVIEFLLLIVRNISMIIKQGSIYQGVQFQDCM